MTGMSTSRRISPAKSRKGADGVPIEGMTRASVASLSMVPLITLSRSTPSCVNARSAVSASSRCRPSGRSSSMDMRIARTGSGPSAARTARMTRRGKAIRCSREPPHSSSRWFVAGERKASSRWP